ncbi:hypothetical protein [Enterobacter roggenkampii]|uniref:hypothetical protein n=1 Tax=Enterobacter roggenkampii TaxID=1812935 RepID=UPI00075102DC|nr:hypothetical protein [Enterobacter roggenkampii]KUR20286.1 hypothetical protein AWI34_20555 [Enterobacter roggenkampii]
MKEFKGTPGKWSFSHSSASDDNVACLEINSSESLHEIAYLQSTPPNIGGDGQTSFDKTIANAHLIAAAPDLLEALQSIIELQTRGYVVLGDKYTNMVSAAISKALGEY